MPVFFAKYFSSDVLTHIPSIVFQHLLPNYSTKGALFISAQLSADAVSAFWKVWILIRRQKQHSIQACTWTQGASAPPPKKKKKKFYLDSHDIGFICAGISNVGGYKSNAWYNLSCTLQTSTWVWCSPWYNCHVWFHWVLKTQLSINNDRLKVLN